MRRSHSGRCATPYNFIETDPIHSKDASLTVKVLCDQGDQLCTLVKILENNMLL